MNFEVVLDTSYIYDVRALRDAALSSFIEIMVTPIAYRDNIVWKQKRQARAIT